MYFFVSEQSTILVPETDNNFFLKSHKTFFYSKRIVFLSKILRVKITYHFFGTFVLRIIFFIFLNVKMIFIHEMSKT